jgi:hypothetical protein
MNTQRVKELSADEIQSAPEEAAREWLQKTK